jgi:hypothetical protein
MNICLFNYTKHLQIITQNKHIFSIVLFILNLFLIIFVSLSSNFDSFTKQLSIPFTTTPELAAAALAFLSFWSFPFLGFSIFAFMKSMRRYFFSC